MDDAEDDDYDAQDVSDLEYGSEEEEEDEYDSELEEEFFGKKNGEAREDKKFNLKEFKD
jgi:hypothetical protein